MVDESVVGGDGSSSGVFRLAISFSSFLLGFLGYFGGSIHGVLSDFSLLSGILKG